MKRHYDSKLSIRLTDEQKAKLETIAKKLDCSLAYVVKRAIEQYAREALPDGKIAEEIVQKQNPLFEQLREKEEQELQEYTQKIIDEFEAEANAEKKKKPKKRPKKKPIAAKK